jgi:hypothetical protein
LLCQGGITGRGLGNQREEQGQRPRPAALLRCGKRGC